MRAHPAGPRHADLDPPHSAPASPLGDGLAAGVWPITALRGPRDRLGSGAIEIGGCDVRDLAAEFGTPLHVLDRADWDRRVDAFARNGVDVYYAAQAFLCTAIARWAVEAGLGIDVCTGGELAVAIAAEVPPESIIFHGNNKSEAELDAGVRYGVHRFVVDSFEEIVRLARVAQRHDTVADVLVRVTVGVEAHTHEFIATANEDPNFGLALSTGEAMEAVRRIVGLSTLRFRGLHSRIGSQIFDAAGFELAAHRLVTLAGDVVGLLDVAVEELSLGGGFGITCTGADDPVDPASIVADIRMIVARECAAAGIALPRIAIEPGRALIGPAMVTVYEVGTVKRVLLDGGSTRTYASVDGGMSDNIRTAIYGAEYTVELASRVSTMPRSLHRIVGKHCEAGDIVVRDALMPGDLASGDLLAVAATGGCRSMASTYNFLGRAPVVAVEAGESRLIVRRETIEDLLTLDTGIGLYDRSNSQAGERDGRPDA